MSRTVELPLNWISSLFKGSQQFSALLKRILISLNCWLCSSQSLCLWSKIKLNSTDKPNWKAWKEHHLVIRRGASFIFLLTGKLPQTSTGTLSHINQYMSFWHNQEQRFTLWPSLSCRHQMAYHLSVSASLQQWIKPRCLKKLLSPATCWNIKAFLSHCLT